MTKYILKNEILGICYEIMPLRFVALRQQLEVVWQIPQQSFVDHPSNFFESQLIFSELQVSSSHEVFENVS
jgi:hypothetical protein